MIKYGGNTVEQLRRLLAKSTPGDWEVDTVNESHGEQSYAKIIADSPWDPKKIVDVADTMNADWMFTDDDRMANLLCLVAAREALLPLLDRIAHLEYTCETAKKQFIKYREHHKASGDSTKELTNDVFAGLMHMAVTGETVMVEMQESDL